MSDRLMSGIVMFYLARGHSTEEAMDYAARHMNGESGFVANEPPEQGMVITEELKRQVNQLVRQYYADLRHPSQKS